MPMHIPGIDTTGERTWKMPHEAHSATKTENEIYDDEKYGPLEVFVLLMFVEIIGIDRKKCHREAASTNSWTFWKKWETYSYKKSRPSPEYPCPFFPIGNLDNTTYEEKKYNIAQRVEKTSMEKAIHDEFLNTPEKPYRSWPDSTVDNNVWIDNID